RALGSSDRCNADTNSASACAALMPKRFLVVGIAGLPGGLTFQLHHVSTTNSARLAARAAAYLPAVDRASQGGAPPRRRARSTLFKVGSVAVLAVGPAACPRHHGQQRPIGGRTFSPGVTMTATELSSDASLAAVADLAGQLRVDSVRASTSAGSGHPTSSMSAADLLAVLITRHLRYDWQDPRSAANDHLIFSKGHASPLLYAVFKAVGVVSDEELMTGYRRFDQRLEGHPTPVLPWVDVATGSLGQ